MDPNNHWMHLRKEYQNRDRIHGETEQAIAGFSCKMCSRIYTRKLLMYTHLRLCSKEPKFNCSKKFKYEVQIAVASHVECAMMAIYLTTTTAREYLERKSEDFYHTVNRSIFYLRKTWICFQCGKRYLWRGSLKNHIRVECGKEPAFMCPVCGRRFKHKHRWQSHARCMHSIKL
ncbi:hypothetical protein HN011_000373 [Eciton burchellii]|nr:hypothetical protein HN011_000373 [Eciton burchellii]